MALIRKNPSFAILGVCWRKIEKMVGMLRDLWVEEYLAKADVGGMKLVWELVGLKGVAPAFGTVLPIIWKEFGQLINELKRRRNNL